MRPKNLKKLQAEWYARLKADGFEDIEDNNGLLIKWSSKSASQARQSLTDYYRLASQYYHDKKFPTVLDKRMWGLHAEGKTLSYIAKVFEIPKATVQHRIERLRKAFYEDSN